MNGVRRQPCAVRTPGNGKVRRVTKRQAHRPLARAGVARLRPGVLLDKDGTVLEDVPFNVDPAQMRFAPGAAAALRRLARLRCPLVVISNQAGVAHGRFPISALPPMWQRLRELFASQGAHLVDCYFCPHHPTGSVAPFACACDCRKPAPGMLRAALWRYRLDAYASWFVGDILDDVEAGHRAGCRAILIDNGNETVWREGPFRHPDASVADLDRAARLIAAALRRSHRGTMPAARPRLSREAGVWRERQAARVDSGSDRTGTADVADALEELAA